MQRVAAAATRAHGRRRLHRLDYPAARNDSGTIRSTTPRRSSATAASSSAPARRSCPTTAISTTSASSRPRTGASPWMSRSAGGPARVGVSICEDMWDEFYDVKPLPELAAKGAALLLNINASPFYPGKRHERDALIRRHIAQLAEAGRLRQHGGRGRQRQEHHSVRRREPRLRPATAGCSPSAGSSTRTC